MPAIEPYRPAHLAQLTGLVNAHLSTAMPGLALTGERLASSLVDEPGQPVLNPWVAERLVAPEDEADGAGRFHRRLGMEPLSRAKPLGPHPDWPAPPPPACRVQEPDGHHGGEDAAARASS